METSVAATIYTFTSVFRILLIQLLFFLPPLPGRLEFHLFIPSFENVWGGTCFIFWMPFERQSTEIVCCIFMFSLQQPQSALKNGAVAHFLLNLLSPESLCAGKK